MVQTDASLSLTRTVHRLAVSQQFRCYHSYWHYSRLQLRIFAMNSHDVISLLLLNCQNILLELIVSTKLLPLESSFSPMQIISFIFPRTPVCPCPSTWPTLPHQILLSHYRDALEITVLFVRAVLGLEKNWADSVKGSHIPPHSTPQPPRQFALLTSCISVVHLPQIINQYWHIIRMN